MTERCEGRSGIEEKYRHLIACHQIVTTIASAFADIHTDKIDEGVEGALKSIGEFIGASRGLVLLLDSERKRFDCTHEWCPEGAESLRGRLQNLDVENFPWWMKSFGRLEGLGIARLDDIPPEGQQERHYLESLGICSCVVAPFDWRGDLPGFMAFGSQDMEIMLPGECIALLGVVGGVFAGAMARKQVGEALRESEELMTAMTDNIPGLVYRMTTHRDGGMSMDYVSPGAQDLVWPEDSALEGSCQDLLSFVHEDDRELIERAIASAWDDPRPIDVEIRLVFPSGQIRWVRDIARPQVGPDAIAWHGVLIDITERKEAEINLEESERRFRTLFEKAPIGVGVATMEGKIIAWNDAVMRTVGYSAEELLEINVSDLYLNPEDRNVLLECLKGDGLARDHDAILKHKDGSPYHARLTIAKVQYEGREVLMTSIEDVTERKRAEDLLRIQRDIGLTIGSTSDLAAAFDYLLESVCRLEGTDCGGVYSLDPRTGELDLMAHRGLSDEFIQNVSHFSQDSPNTAIVVAGEPVYANYQDLNTSQGEIHRTEGLQGIAVIPVKHEGGVIAALNIASHSNQEIPAVTRHMLEAIAAQVGGLLARFRTEEALKQTEGRHRLLAENISDVIWTMDMEMNGVEYVSPSVRNLTGFTPGELTRMSMSEMLAPGSLDRATSLLKSHIESVRAGTFEPITVEMDLLRRNGDTVSTESIISVAYDGAGTPLYILGVTRDVSGRKRLEDQLRQSAKMQAIGELAGGVAHEFNNMLTGILGYANMLRLTAEPGTTVHESARTIERAAERAADLTRKLLGFARRGRHRRENVNLHELIRDVITLLRRTISESIQISCEMNPDDIFVTGDAGQLEQVLLNLALNARDAMPSGGDLAISTGSVELDDTSHLPEPDIEPGRYAVLTFTDTGKGITREDSERIFEPFFTTKGQGRGTGMGLAMVYGTVRNHGGFVEVDSKPGEGATFKVYIPLDRCAVEDEQKPEAHHSLQPGSGRILVVDDEDLVRDVARSMLEVCGYEVVAVSNGREAVEYYRDHGDGIDLVLIDMVMPEMSGRECFRALREMDPGVRAVLSTGYGADGEAREVVQEGMAGLVLKPFSKGALSATIREALTEESLPTR